MTPEQFRAIRQTAGMTQAALAEYLGLDHLRTVQKWEYGERKIPGPVVKLMEELDRKTRRRNRP